MRIDEAGNNCSALEIDEPGVRSGKLSDVGRLSNGQDPAVTESDSFLTGELLIDSNDLSVCQYRIRCLSPRHRAREQGD